MAITKKLTDLTEDKWKKNLRESGKHAIPHAIATHAKVKYEKRGIRMYLLVRLPKALAEELESQFFVELSVL
jgi:hypothetical protein